MRFKRLRVEKIVKETEDCVSVQLSWPEDKDLFQFKAGQYLTFKQDINGEEVRRSYSLCSAPYEDVLKVAVKQVTGGRFSTYANEVLKEGDELEVMKPMGRFCSRLPKDEPASVLLFAAGSGITPVISIVKDLLEENAQANVTLVYGNKGFDHIIFREEIEGLKNLYMGRFTVHHVLSREVLGEPIYNGRIDEQKCNDLFNTLLNVESYDEFFMCGPEQMTMSVRDYLLGQGVEAGKVHFELFTVPGQAKTEEKVEEISGADGKDVLVILDGIEYPFKLPTEGDSILDAAHKVGADLPYACKGGVCCTCRAKVVEGSVNMDVNYALEEDEVEQGFVLTCQSHPTSDRVVINFDIV